MSEAGTSDLDRLADARFAQEGVIRSKSAFDPESDIWQNRNHPATCGSKSQRLDELAIGLASPPVRINVRHASRPPERRLAWRSRKMGT